MTKQDAIAKATEVFHRLNKEGIQPLDEIGWMNPEDVSTIVEPFAEAILVAYQMWQFGIASPNLAATVEEIDSQDYQDDSFCDHCNAYTLHQIHDSGHERDSSYDSKECLTCGSKSNGLSGDGVPMRFQSVTIYSPG